MAITKPSKITATEPVKVRDNVTAIDSAAINTTNYPVANAVECAGWASVMVYPRFQNGTNPTWKIRPLYLDGNAWVSGAESTSGGEGQGIQVTTYGRKIFVLVTELAGGVASTDVDMYCAGFEPIHYDGPRAS